jgi:hypothetical protein
MARQLNLGIPLVVLGRTAGYMFIAILGAGGIAPFFSRPPLIALGIVLLTLVISALVAGGNLISGVREARGLLEVKSKGLMETYFLYRQ